MTPLEDAGYAVAVVLAVGAVRLLWAFWHQVCDHRPEVTRTRLRRSIRST